MTAPQAWHHRDHGFPNSLRDVRPAVVALFTLGDRSVLDGPRVAIVGTREMTGYGERVTRRLAASLARAGVCVVSGMARGIDATAHRAVLEVGGRTVAVLGTGVDVPYPAGHRHLHADIAAAGLVISEERPGTRAGPGCFPRRNRIIAGLAQLTIVVEAGFKSGAHNTVGHALAGSGQIAAVPGPIDSPQSQGCNLLIQQGAQIVTCVNDVFALLGLPPEREERPALPATEQKLWELLAEQGGASADLLGARSGLPIREMLTALTSLELEGLIEMDTGGVYRTR